MHKGKEEQLAFDFSDHKKAPENQVPIQSQRVAVVYSFSESRSAAEKTRLAKQKQNLSSSYSEILKLVAHLDSPNS
jgi:hypothetical protein